MARRRKEYSAGDVLPVRLRTDDIAAAINIQHNASAFINDAIEFYIQSGFGQTQTHQGQQQIDVEKLVARIESVIEGTISRYAMNPSIQETSATLDLENVQDPEKKEQEEIRNVLDTLADW